MEEEGGGLETKETEGEDLEGVADAWACRCPSGFGGTDSFLI